MKNLFALLLFISLSFSVLAQRTFTETQSAAGIQDIEFTTEFASLTIETWNREEIEIEGYIDIYNNEANDSFEWKAERKGDRFLFSSNTNFPKWNNKSKWNNDCNQTSNIRLTVRVPKNRKLITRATYGTVQVTGIEHTADIKSTYGGVDIQVTKLPKDKLCIESTYGHVDIAIAASAKATLTLKTPYGETLTDLPLTIQSSKEHVVGSTLVAALNGGGTPIYAEAGYHKIYLREL